jgi:hypothetical protein
MSNLFAVVFCEGKDDNCDCLGTLGDGADGIVGATGTLGSVAS